MNKKTTSLTYFSLHWSVQCTILDRVKREPLALVPTPVKFIHKLLLAALLSPLVAFWLKPPAAQNSLTTQFIEPKPAVIIASEAHSSLTAVSTVDLVSYTAPTQTANTGALCGDNSYANYIYEHESGCSTTVTNALGCLGIGQACPGSKLSNACPNLDYACENAFFTNYANAVYGGWYNAYIFWTNHSWW